MKRLIMVGWTVVMLAMVGCAGNREAILKATVQTRQNVFQVVQSSQSVNGSAFIKIEFPVKNFKARFDGKYFKHSDPPYTTIINIDGQPVELTDEPVLEDLAGDPWENPEAGTGWRYVFKKTLQLEPGSHRITIAIPLSDVVVEKELTLNEGVNLLKIEPKYNNSGSRHSHYPRFSNGLRGIMVQLNSQTL